VALLGIFRKAGVPGIFAFIPVFNLIKWLQIVNRPVWWIIFLLWWISTIFLIAVLSVDTLKRFNLHRFYQQMLAMVFGIVYYPFLGFSKRRMVPPDEVSKTKFGRYISVAAAGILTIVFFRTLIVGFYTIPTPSLEKTILVGDYLAVNKWMGGARIPFTPVAFTWENKISVLGWKSYLPGIQLPYMRLPAFRKIKNNDWVVFNWPGDNDDLPIDRKESYLKRCVAIPGDTLEIREGVVYINGKKNKDFPGLQLDYYVNTDGTPINEKVLRDLDVDEPTPTSMPGQFYFWLTSRQADELRKFKNVSSVIPNTIRKSDTPMVGEGLFPGDAAHFPYNIDNYGPLVIPKKGVSCNLNLTNIALYQRLISHYEENQMELTNDGKILINGKEANQYTFKKDYYWMMGDNRHNSLDSRYWGFVPEDYIIGRATWIYGSYDKTNDKIRWNRFFKRLE